jgi:hypothetical protein
MSIKSQGAAAPIKGLLAGMIEAVGLVTGAAGSVAQTLTAGCRGIASITGTATGKYTVVFSDVGQVFLGATFGFLGVTGTATACVGKVVSYTASTKTMTIEVYDLGATPALVDLTDAMQMFVRVLWADSGAP